MFPPKNPPRRGNVSGWSDGAVKRNTEFLMSVLVDKLTGAGVALTLTLRDCPPTSDDWSRIRRSWEKRMVRAGMIRLHWVTEWQRRGVPHLHCAIWFPETYDLITPVTAWLALTERYGALPSGQHARQIDGAVGWFQYMSKHAARGMRHYQRCQDAVPQEWQNKTGRVWGKVGDWPVWEKIRINLQDQHGDGGWFAYRRLIRSWRIAEARQSKDIRRLKYARKMLTCSDTSRSRVIGFMEWIPYDVQMALISNIAFRGYSVTC